jgi:hypothetical protein
MANMTSEHSKLRSALTVSGATGKSRCLLVKTEEASTDSSEFRVGSFHLSAGDARTVPMFTRVIGTV